ncbi:MAG TPA: cytochrome b/b6 domain-containing protein [Bryobacteraceae bacterium]|nr:cytochrome b/b6 domain-containing protein [Bryobacteraceae bacterium]
MTEGPSVHIEEASKAGAPVRNYVRFSLAQRYLHGIFVLTFLGLALTGLPLRFSHAGWALKFAGAVGGFGTILFFHKTSAAIMSVAFLTHVANILYRVVVCREFGLVWGPDSMVPRLKDFTDFFANLKWFFWLGPKPKFDRYAYWDKVDYWAVFWGMAIIGLSGYAMWFPQFFVKFIPGSWLNIALLIHGEEAILAVGFIFTIHYFNTHLRPQNFPMDLTIFTGRQTEQEFKERHPVEYERLAKSGELETLAAPEPPLWLKNFARLVGGLAVVAGLVMLYLLVVAFIND